MFWQACGHFLIAKDRKCTNSIQIMAFGENTIHPCFSPLIAQQELIEMSFFDPSITTAKCKNPP